MDCAMPEAVSEKGGVGTSRAKPFRPRVCECFLAWRVV